MKRPTLKFGPWRFSPGLMSSLSTLLILPLLVYLGCWQLDRAREKEVLQKKLENGIFEPSPQPSPASGRGGWQVTGTFLNERQILWDNQIHQGRAGYHVITPFLFNDSHTILLVDRGWIPMGDSRKNLPRVPAVLGQQSIAGIMRQPTKGLQLKQIPLDLNSWPLRVQHIDFKALSSVFSQELYPFILQLHPQDPIGFQITPITLNMSKERHLGYAIQWFTMAVAVFIYFLVINVKRETYGKI